MVNENVLETRRKKEKAKTLCWDVIINKCLFFDSNHI